MGFIADVFDAVLIDNKTKQVFASATLQEANIEVEVTENEIRGGKGNQLLAVLHTDRSFNIPLTDAEFRYDWLAAQLGQDIKTGAGIAYAMPKWYKVEDDGSGEAIITLNNTPISQDSLAIYDYDGKRITGFTLNGNEVSFSGATPMVNIGDEVEVRTYQYQTDPDTQIIAIDNSVFAKGVTLILETIEIDADEQPTHRIQYKFPNAIPTGTFNINTTSAREGVAQEFSLRIVKPRTTTVVGEVLRFPYKP